MMFHLELYLAERTVEKRVAQMLSWDQSPRTRDTSGTELLARRMLGRLALLLVSLGARLVRYGLPPYHPLDGDLKGGSPSTTAA